MVDIIMILKNDHQNGKRGRGIIFHNYSIQNVLISVLNKKWIAYMFFFVQYNPDMYDIANIVYKTAHHNLLSQGWFWIENKITEN